MDMFYYKYIIDVFDVDVIVQCRRYIHHPTVRYKFQLICTHHGRRSQIFCEFMVVLVVKEMSIRTKDFNISYKILCMSIMANYICCYFINHFIHAEFYALM